MSCAAHKHCKQCDSHYKKCQCVVYERKRGKHSWMENVENMMKSSTTQTTLITKVFHNAFSDFNLFSFSQFELNLFYIYRNCSFIFLLRISQRIFFIYCSLQCFRSVLNDLIFDLNWSIVLHLQTYYMFHMFLCQFFYFNHCGVEMSFFVVPFSSVIILYICSSLKYFSKIYNEVIIEFIFYI